MEQMWELDKELSCGVIDQNLRELHKKCEVEAGLCTTILWNDRSAFLDVSNMRLGKHIIINLYKFVRVLKGSAAYGNNKK